MIYFVVDAEYDHTKEESDNHEDLNMNTEKEQNNVNEAAENNARLVNTENIKIQWKCRNYMKRKKRNKKFPKSLNIITIFFLKVRFARAVRLIIIRPLTKNINVCMCQCIGFVYYFVKA